MVTSRDDESELPLASRSPKRGLPLRSTVWPTRTALSCFQPPKSYRHPYPVAASPTSGFAFTPGATVTIPSPIFSVSAAPHPTFSPSGLPHRITRTVAPPRPSDPPTTANGSCFHPRHSSTELPRCTSRSPPLSFSLSVLFFFRDTFCLFFPLSFSLSENSSGFTVNRCYSFSQVRMARRISSLETSQSVRSRLPRSD